MTTIDEILKARTGGGPTTIDDILAQRPKGSGNLAEVPEGLAQGYRKSLEFLTGAPGELYQGIADLMQYFHDNSMMPPMAKGGFQRDIDSFRGARKDLWTGKDAQGTEYHFGLPTMSEVQQKISNPAFGPSPEMQTFPGRVAEGIGENILGARGGFMRDAVLPAVGSEVGAKVAKDLGGSETLGRLFGGIGAPTVAGVPKAAFQHAAIGQMEPRRVALTRVLMDAGVDITGGQATGSKPLKYLEAGPFSGRPQNIANRQSAQYTDAIMREAGMTGLPTPDVLNLRRDAFGTQFDDLITRTGGVPLDEDLTNDILQNILDYENLKGLQPGSNSPASALFARISSAAQANGNVIPPDIYKVLHSDIVRLAKRTADPELRTYLGDLRDSLYASIDRNAGPDVTADWQETRRQYRNYMTIKKAMKTTGEGTNVEGQISPAKLLSVMQADPNFPNDTSRMAELARGGSILKDVPQSGTAARQAFGPLAGMAMTMPHSLADLDSDTAMKMMAMAAAGTAGHETLGRVAASRPVSTRIINAASTPPLPPVIGGDAAQWQVLQALQNRLDEGRR